MGLRTSLSFTWLTVEAKPSQAPDKPTKPPDYEGWNDRKGALPKRNVPCVNLAGRLRDSPDKHIIPHGVDQWCAFSPHASSHGPDPTKEIKACMHWGEFRLTIQRLQTCPQVRSQRPSWTLDDSLPHRQRNALRRSGSRIVCVFLDTHVLG